mgnify:FL=1|uniref:hypothetical protein n=1 Tax=Alloprevotella sp. TaxID=1872471 RepID=UPI003FEFDCBB
MKKTYITPQASAIRLQMESQILGVSGFHDELSGKEQLSDERGWADEWDTVEED